MSSLLDQRMAEGGRPVLLEQLSRPVVYTAPAVSSAPGDAPEPVTLAGIVGDQRREEVSGPGGRDWRRVCDVTVSSAELPDPRSDAVVSIDGVEWAIDGLEASASFVTLRLVRPETAERSRPGYRGGR